MRESFKREGMLLGEPALEKLQGCHVAVFGLGGVGSWCAEALARSGVGELTLVDSDDFSESNINRQLGALSSTVGLAKTEVTAARLKDINPELILHAKKALYASDMIEGFDYVADCIDTVSAKLDLISTCLERGVPVISSMGTGNKQRAELLEIGDISKTKNDALARVMRKELRNRGINHVPVVWSPELPLAAEPTDEIPPEGRRSIPGSLVWVPAAAGLLMCQHIVTELIK